MKIISILAAAVAAATPTSGWSGGFGPHCPRCQSATNAGPMGWDRPVPRHALFYFVIGEFARQRNAWMIDLDTGVISLNTAGASGWGSRTAIVSPDRLKILRASALEGWGERPSRQMCFAPGSELGLEIVADGRVVRLCPETPRYRYLEAPFEQAIAESGLAP